MFKQHKIRSIMLSALTFTLLTLASYSFAAPTVLASLEGDIRVNDPTREIFSTASAMNGDSLVLTAIKRINALNLTIAETIGEVYVYKRTAGVWTQQAVLTASIPADRAFYGASVAINGDTLAVSCFNFEPQGTATQNIPLNPTSIRPTYVYQRVNGQWLEKARLVGSDALTDSRQFGVKVATNTNTVLVGASGGVKWHYNSPYTSEPRHGVIYAFQKNAVGVWVQTAKLTENPLGTRDNFGGDLSLDGNTLVTLREQMVPSPIFGTYATTRAVVRQQAGSLWSIQAILAANDQTTAAQIASPTQTTFRGLANQPVLKGNSLIMYGQDAVLDDGEYTARPTIYVFQRTGTTWAQQTKMTPRSTINGGLVYDGTFALMAGKIGEVKVFARNGTSWFESSIKSQGTLAIDAGTAAIVQLSRTLVYRLTVRP